MKTIATIIFACASLLATGSIFAGTGSWSLRKPAEEPVKPADTAQARTAKGATGPEGTPGPDSKPRPATRSGSVHR